MKIYKNKNKRLKIKSPKRCVFASFSLLNYVVRLSHIASKLAESKIPRTHKYAHKIEWKRQAQAVLPLH